ncbi:histidine kinase [Xylanimonas protaetiae]|nr:histidine kinase [Xylanimonas protaetiae]
MDITRYVDDLQQRLTQAAETGGPEAQQIAQRLTGTLDAAVRLVLLDALSAAAGEISTELAPGSVDVRLRGGEPEFVVALPEPDAGRTGAAPAPASFAPPAPPADAEDGATTRTTLRLPDNLKAQVEVSAARDGVSVNTWLVRAVSAALAQGTPAGTTRVTRVGGTHVTGWVR